MHNGKHRSNGLASDAVIPSAHQPLEMQGWGRPRYSLLKDVFDFVFALTLLVLTAPLLLALAALVKLTSRGPALYLQTRLGRRGRPYTLYKLRTMTENCERETGACWATPRDPRITWFGAFLRKTHLDELPQLWNVLRGEMSLVGPRPERPEFVPALADAIPHYRDRLLVKPGVTGLAQVRQAADIDMDSVRRKLTYDLYYVRHMSFWLDLRLILCTGFKMLGVPFRILAALFWLPTSSAVSSPPSAAAPGTEQVPVIQPGSDRAPPAVAGFSADFVFEAAERV